MYWALNNLFIHSRGRRLPAPGGLATRLPSPPPSFSAATGRGQGPTHGDPLLRSVPADCLPSPAPFGTADSRGSRGSKVQAASPGAKGHVVPSVVSARGPPQPRAASWRELPRAPGRTSTPQPCPTPLLEARLSTSRSRRSLPRFSQTRGPWPPRPTPAGTRNRWAPGVSALGKHFDRWSGLPEGPGGMDSPIFRLSEGGNQGLGTKSRVRHHSLCPEETFI